MNVPRESQFNALAAQVQTAQLNGLPTFVTCSRKFRQWDAMAPSELPACFITHGFEFASQNVVGDTKWRTRALLYVYVPHSPDDEIPGALLNNVLDSLDQCIAPAPWADGRQTLGGVVTRCYIDGEVIIAEGMQAADQMSIAMVPVTLETGQ